MRCLCSSRRNNSRVPMRSALPSLRYYYQTINYTNPYNILLLLFLFLFPCFPRPQCCFLRFAALNMLLIQFNNSNVHLLPPMPKEEQPQTFHFILVLAAVKMRVKFPCRMAVEQSGHAVTQEVQPNQEGRFIFNQEIRLREDSQKMYAELNICLVTEKGARYTSGMIKLYHSELIRAEGERLVITLAKCLDPEALCEIKVQKVVREGGERKRTLTTIPERNLRANARNNDQVHSGLLEFKSPQKAELPMVSNETKSEAHFPVTSNMRFRKEESDTRTKQYLGMLGSPTNGKRMGNSPKNKARPANSKSKFLSFQFNGELERDKQIEAEVYKNNYQQLKHKYIRETENSKNQLSRRMMLENNENNFKIEIVRLKLRNDQLQKNIAEKNIRLKEYAANISILQGRQAQLNFMRQDISNKDHSLQIMQETIIALSKQNDELRTANKDIAYKLEEKIMMLENEIDAADARSLARVQDLERELKMANETLQFKEGEINRKAEMLEKEKKNVHQLERALQNKLFQYDSLLQNQRNSCKQKIEDIKHKLDDSAHTISKLTNQKGQLQIQLDKLKGSLLKNQYEFKLYQQQLNTLKAQLQQLRPFRQKYNEIFKQLRIITQQKVTIERTHEKYMHSKDFAIQEITLEYKKELEFQKRNVKDLEERNKTLTSKFLEVDGLHEIAKGSLEKLKRNHESLNKDYAELKDKEKNLKKNLKQKEEECDDIKKEVTRLKEKNQAIFESMKTEISKVRQQLAKAKIQLQSQSIKNQELLETNNELSMELARLKMTHQFSQQKYQKLLSSAQEKYSQFQKIIKQHQGVIELLEDKIKAQKQNEKDYYSRLQKCDYEINLVVDKNEKIIKETRNIQERNRQLEFSIKSKQTQIADYLKKIAELETKLASAQEKGNEVKEQLQLSRNQLQKGKKIIQILQRDYQKSKSEVLSYSQRLSDKQRQLQQKTQQSRRDKQSISSLQSKSSSLKKQYDKFKESVTEALNTSFAQIIHTFSIDKQDSSRTSTMASIEHSNSNLMAAKRGLADLSNDLVNVISMAGKENKGQISKLTDRNKQLERDIELIRSELQRNIEHSKRQIQDKSHYIQQLQEQLRNIRNDKGESEVQYQVQVSEIEEHLKQYQTQCNSLLTIKSELEFSLSGLKMETERIIEEYERKIHQMKNQMLVYEEKLEFQYHSTEVVEKKVHELEVELMNLNSVVMLEKEGSYKNDLKTQQLQEDKQRLNKEIQGLKRHAKQSQQKYSQLQIHYLTVTEIKAKYESMLSQQESKLKEIRSFNSNILKEKEEIIKKQLEKNMEIASLENTVIELRHQLQQEETSKNKYKNDCEEIKETSRRFSLQIKELESSVTFQKSKYNEIRDKLREKQQSLSDMKEEVASLKKKLEEGGSKYKTIIEELKEQNDMITGQVKIITSEKDESIRTLEAQIAKYAQQLQTARQQIGEIEESVFVERENNHSLFENTNKIKYQLEEYKKKIEEMEHSYAQLLEENRQKDEAMFEMGGKIYEYESRMRELQEQKQRQIEEMNNSLNVKYDEDYQEIYQKIEFIEKEREYFREKYQEKEECIARKNEELKHKEIEEMELKRAYQEKIRKLEEEKLVIFTDKNREVSKVLEENKSQFQAIRLKESEIRKLAHQLEISRTTIQKIQAKIKEMQNDKNSQVKAYQSQVQSLRKKELTFKSYKDVIRSNQWNCERQVRKNIQNFIKRILEAGEKESRNESVISLIKGLEQGLLGAIGTISSD